MNRKQLMNLFETNGLTNYQLRNASDLFKIFGIKSEEIQGFDTLGDENKDLFSEFLLNFYNIHGIDNKLAITPEYIYLVEEIETCVKENPEDDYLVHSGTKITVLDKDLNSLQVLMNTSDEEHKALEKIIMEPKVYLKFVYVYQYPDGDSKKEWLHVTSETEWY